MSDFLWLDLETTGLNPKTCRVIEVAAIITSDNHIPRDKFQAVVYQNPHVGWEGIALEMHKKSGLYQLATAKEAVDERDAMNGLYNFLAKNCAKPENKVFLAGNTVHFDRSFINEQWPNLMPWFSHRHLDVSSFKVFAEGHGIHKFGGPNATPAHRAMDDIEHSIKEFAYYLAEIKKLP